MLVVFLLRDTGRGQDVDQVEGELYFNRTLSPPGLFRMKMGSAVIHFNVSFIVKVGMSVHQLA